MMSFTYKFFTILFLFVAVLGCKSDDSESQVVDPKAENLKGLGTSSEDILSDDIYKSLRVELVYSAAYKPTTEAVNDFKDFVNERVHKPGGVLFTETVIPQPSGAPFSTAEIREIEAEVRTEFTRDDSIAIYVFFANGRSSGDTDTTVTLGTAYQNTSIVIYEDTLRFITQDNTPLLPILEATVLNHEFGHILGLTNILNDDIHEIHEDIAHLKHCDIEGCLMFFDATNVGRPGLQRMLRMGGVPQLDPLCIADLQAKGGK